MPRYDTWCYNNGNTHRATVPMLTGTHNIHVSTGPLFHADCGMSDNTVLYYHVYNYFLFC